MVPTTMGEYARHSQALIQLVIELRTLGAEADFNLPKIVVIGNQSAGKSSIVEAMADITVPRDMSTCTRCPTECRLSYSTGPWECQILLRFEKDDDGARLPEVKEILFGPPLREESQLEPMLRRAQLAILNPSLSATKFVNYDLTIVNMDHVPDGSERQLPFSGNVVILDLKGPKVPDLSFIDLPGIIASVGEHDDPKSIDLIRNLVKEQIAGNALILTVITMRDDIDNQSGVTLARDADKNGLRTIGVLTKPDTIQPGEEPVWLNILHGKRYKLHHGYFVTRQAGPQDLKAGMDRAAAREQGRTFFKTTPPWKDAASNVRHRLGVENLSKELSRLLSILIEQSLPHLRAQSRESLQETNKLLLELPPPPSQNPTHEIIGLVTSFCNALHGITQPTDGNEAVLQACRQLYLGFKKDIEDTTPVFSVTPNTMSDTETAKPRSLGSVHKMIQRTLTRELPMNVPPSVKARLTRQCFEEWPSFADKCFIHVHRVVYSALGHLIKEHFSHYGPLREEISIVVDAFLGKVKADVEERLDWALKLNNPAFTFNDHYFTTYRERYLKLYRQEHQFGPFEWEVGPLEMVVTIPDKYEEEIVVMAEVRAYFQVAYKRVIDLIPLIIDHDFIRILDGKMQGALLDTLGIGQEGAAARHASYVREDPDIVQRREELVVKKVRLEEINSKLANFALGS